MGPTVELGCQNPQKSRCSDNFEHSYRSNTISCAKKCRTRVDSYSNSEKLAFISIPYMDIDHDDITSYGAAIIHLVEHYTKSLRP